MTWVGAYQHCFCVCGKCETGWSMEPGRDGMWVTCDSVSLISCITTTTADCMFYCGLRTPFSWRWEKRGKGWHKMSPESKEKKKKEKERKNEEKAKILLGGARSLLTWIFFVARTERRDGIMVVLLKPSLWLPQPLPRLHTPEPPHNWCHGLKIRLNWHPLLLSHSVSLDPQLILRANLLSKLLLITDSNGVSIFLEKKSKTQVARCSFEWIGFSSWVTEVKL